MKKVKVNFIKKLFNLITYLAYILIFDLLKINLKKINNLYNKKYFEKSRKKSLIFNIYHNFLSNFIRYNITKNFNKISNNPYIDYFDITKTSFLKKNQYFKSGLRKKFVYFDFLLKKRKNIIHIGSSTSFNNYHHKMKYKDKKYFQIDLNKKITLLNKQLFNFRNFHNFRCDILKIPFYLKKFKIENNLIYSLNTFIYVPKKKIEIFLIELKRIKKIDLYLVEVGSEENETFFNFGNPIIFSHNYKEIFKRTGWYYNKIVSDSDRNIHVARNYI